jgi:8-oxo-dGTP pyrophosphatase MutT (NUDIX family)
MTVQDEIVVVVDENNNVVGKAPRYIMRNRGLAHRATYILVFNWNGELFVQKRTPTKDIYPGYYDVATGGVVLAGETYEESARRELEEELGIRGVPLTRLFDFYYEETGNRVWGRAYTCIYDGRIDLQEEEVENGRFCSVDEVCKLSEHEPFTPDSMDVLRRYLCEQL